MTTDNTDQAITSTQPGPHGEGTSALFDGQLRGDAGRFAIRRLAHDARWGDACGRWQLAGDVLRGQAVAAAPSGFAEGIANALASESVGQVASSGAVASSGRRGWLAGGALAASVAVATLLVVRPSLDAPRKPVAGDGVVATSGPRAGGAVAATSGPATANASVATSTASRATVASVPQAPKQRVALQAPAPGIQRGKADASDPTQRSRLAAGRIAAASQVVVSPVERAPVAPATLALPSSVAAAAESVHPFRPQPGEIVTRPWPGERLMDGSTDGAFTVSYDLGRADGASPQRSFYPFEPVVPAALQSRQRQQSILRARQMIRARAPRAVEGPPSH